MFDVVEEGELVLLDCVVGDCVVGLGLVYV